jgi:phospholipase/carboxylesterase
MELSLKDLLSVIEMETAQNPQFSVIWLHGLGADGSDFVPIVPELALDAACGVRFIFPDAPLIPVTCNGGYVMRAWYDIVSLDSSSRQIDEAGIVGSRQAIRALMARENQRGTPSRKLFIAGFSQGGAIAYSSALTHPETLAGVIALSTYIPSARLLLAEASAANRQTPIFAAHGSADDVVSPALGLAARDLLIAQHYPLEWCEYPMAHSVCPEEIIAIGQWLNLRMAALR